MKNLMKVILPLFVLLICSHTTFAQNETYRKNIHIGTGFSLGAAMLSSMDTIGIHNITSSPALQFAYDKAINKRFSVGFAYSHQDFELEHSGFAYSFLGDEIATGTEALIADVNRNNFAVRLLWHYVSRERLDMYVAGRYGFTYWKTDVNYIGEIDDMTAREVVWFAPQVALGLRYYVTPKVGFNIESAFGSPHFLNVGVNYRF
ncbi:MAG: hypothetical protein AB8G11_08970 [Saprospiraceae bacterium]